MITDYPKTISSMELDEKWKAVREMPNGLEKTKAQEELRQYSPKFRMYIGRVRNGSSLVELADAEGRSRLRLQVDTSGVASIEFLDENVQLCRARTIDTIRVNAARENFKGFFRWTVIDLSLEMMVWILNSRGLRSSAIPMEKGMRPPEKNL